MTLVPRILNIDRLLALPEPRFVCVPPMWLRYVVAALAILAAGLGGILVHRGVAEAGAWGVYFAALGAAMIAAGAWMLIGLRPLRARSWINLAATPKGIYFTGRRRAVLFVPWADISAIDVVARGRHRYAAVEMRLDADGWKHFGPLTEIKGEGAIRRLTLPSLAMEGDEIAAELRRFRANAAD